MTEGFQAIHPGVLAGLSYVSFQELATRVSHRNTGIATGDPIAEQLLALLRFPTASQRFALTGRVRNDQAASVEHPDELLQILKGNTLRSKLRLETILDRLERSLPIEHIEDGELLFMEAEVVQTEGFFDDPIDPPIVLVTPGFQVGTTTQLQGPHRAIDQGIRHGGHRCLFRSFLVDDVSAVRLRMSAARLRMKSDRSRSIGDIIANRVPKNGMRTDYRWG